MKKLQVMIIVLFSVVLLSACNSGTRDLKHYVAKVKKRPPGKIESLPDFPKQKALHYSATKLRSPFNKHLGITRPRKTPDMHREKQPLEAFPLDSLKMVGTISRQGQQWALIGAPDGRVYLAGPGSYLGKHFGKIVKVSAAKIQIKEMIADSRGGWSPRMMELRLQAP